MASTYNKPFLDINSQIDRLINRGLSISDREHAYQQLQAIGYYRLSGYWYPFRKPPEGDEQIPSSEFIPGTTLVEILTIYRFDERFRTEVLNAISRIEVAIRFRVGHLLGRLDPFAHNDASNMNAPWTKSRPRLSSAPNCTEACTWCESGHSRWLYKQARNEEASNEAFTAHIQEHYGTPLPIWTATETMSFGHLNSLFNGMLQRDRQEIAAEFDVYQDDGNGDAATFSNWLEHLRQTRNYCAHHARLWNRNHTAPLAVPEGVGELAHLKQHEGTQGGARPVSRAMSRIYGTLVLISHLLARIDYSNDARDGILDLIQSFTIGRPDRLRSMGFPDGWQDEMIWQADYTRPEEKALQARLLRNVALLYNADAAQRLCHKEHHKDRSSRLKYYRQNGAVLSVPGVASHRYPSFQFDRQTGDIYPTVVLANRRLLDGTVGSTIDRWNALQWWVTFQDRLAKSPKEAVEEGTLTEAAINALLTSRNDEVRTPPRNR